MDKRNVIEFFNRYAPSWDADQVQNTDIINTILDNGDIRAGIDVLDVACGTGVLFPYYMERNVATLTAIDISPEMVKIARRKFADQPKIRILLGDVEETAFDHRFDAVVVYNAFPHFPDPDRLIGVLADLLKPGGRLTVAHGASRAQIDAHHSGAAQGVSNGLMAAEDLARLFAPRLNVDVMISDDHMYQVSGTNKN